MSSDPTSRSVSKSIDLGNWVKSAEPNVAEGLRRQAIEIVLHAIGQTARLRDDLYLKGGTLLNIAYDSPRATKDVDFSTSSNRDEYVVFLTNTLNTAMRTVAAKLVRPNLICRVQSSEMRPPDDKFPWPTLRVKVAYANKGTHQADELEKRRASQVLPLDISFNEMVIKVEDLELEQDSVTIRAYSLQEVIAEKLRAILQMSVRNRDRGQDIYDIARLCRQHSFDDNDKKAILDLFVKKSRARDISPKRDDILSDTIARYAEVRYRALKLEVGADELDYERDLTQVQDFYQSLPWPE